MIECPLRVTGIMTFGMFVMQHSLRYAHFSVGDTAAGVGLVQIMRIVYQRWCQVINDYFHSFPKYIRRYQSLPEF